jgi:hypothetical protein
VTAFLDQVLLAMVREHEDRERFMTGTMLPTDPETPRISD